MIFVKERKYKLVPKVPPLEHKERIFVRERCGESSLWCNLSWPSYKGKEAAVEAVRVGLTLSSLLSL